MQVKYDYNDEGNEMFRIFPSGQNRYNTGETMTVFNISLLLKFLTVNYANLFLGDEVFNSYGRLHNESLLLGVYPFISFLSMLNVTIAFPFVYAP